VKRKLLASVVIVAIAILAFGESSKLIVSWRNPSYSSEKGFNRVLALGLSSKTQVRVDFEDELASQLTSLGLDATPGYSILLRPPGTQLDLTYLKEQIRANQIEAVVVSRLIKVDNTTTYYPGATYVVPFPYYSTFYGYYGTLYPMVYDPGYLQKEKKIRIETNLYVTSEPDGQLVWTGVTDTLNPSNVHKSIQGLVKVVVAQMRKAEVL
jgi:hypothetical protein